MTRFCIRCGEPHSDDSAVCSPCLYDEEPEPQDEETISTLTLAELRKLYGSPNARADLELTSLEPKKRPDGRWEVAA